MSEIRANIVSDGAGTGPATLTGQYTSKVWVNFNGQGTVAIRASGNVSSLTDVAAGQYAVNFSTAMVDSSYSFTMMQSALTDDSATRNQSIFTHSSSSITVETRTNTHGLADAADVTASCIGDLA